MVKFDSTELLDQIIFVNNVHMFIKVKKRSIMEKLESKAYEEEALQVSVVGHVRAPIASITRTICPQFGMRTNLLLNCYTTISISFFL